MSGPVYLVGAGPGDPGLLTRRGAELLGRAEVLVYDYLAAPAILDLAPAGCRRIYVGKQAGCHELSQTEINKLLVEEARAGHCVVRLKGGDPYIFGRGGEEAQELGRAGLAFEVVPGISSTAAAAAYAGIPLTHRDFNSQVALVTGHEREDRPDSALNWTALAQMGALAMVMGVRNLGRVCQSLLAAGKPPATPAALIQWGTTARQKTLVGDLTDLPARAELAGLGPPALLVIGQVVTLREELNWFERRPLFGRQILVTRSREQASRLTAALTEKGAEVWERPTIATRPLPDLADRLRALDLDAFQWLIWTSPNGANFFLKTMLDGGRDARSLAGLRLAALGPGTAEALRPFGLRPDLLPRIAVAENLLEALLAAGVRGSKILLARAQAGREVLPEGLRAAGAEVIDFPVYQTVKAVWAAPLPGLPDLVTFTSASTVAGLADLIPPEERRHYPAATIGPITTRAAEEHGFPVAVEAAGAGIDHLTAAVTDYLQAEK
ncbi:MAG: uroporphyrinogen-III C-methyltransferase [Candidatus Adiutrix sp.]|jgi:uroporphyrinogen III methyltransferase/synthase|nr:uroporphyrinogen-III C-methyltransferase [Candidatus Adiutrix sp.]